MLAVCSELNSHRLLFEFDLFHSDFSANGNIGLDLYKVHRNPGTQGLSELISELRSILSHFTSHQPTYHLANFVGTMSPNSESKMMSAACLNSGSRWTKRMMADVFHQQDREGILDFQFYQFQAAHLDDRLSRLMAEHHVHLLLVPSITDLV